jgi:phosphopantothenoylcysteine decarboxylase/phosphopantothenate--cysteine ligase
MSRILITSGPTRQYLDPVRYLTNASSGRMGAALAAAALAAGHEVTIVSGLVSIAYPPAARVIPVVTTEEMLQACMEVFPQCDGLIGVAAPCDYRPVQKATRKIAKTGKSLVLELVETPDIIATLARCKTHQWMVAFALETDDQRYRALQKLERKNCDLIVLNGPQAIHAHQTDVEVLSRSGETLAALSGPKDEVAQKIFHVIQQYLAAARTERHGWA